MSGEGQCPSFICIFMASAMSTYAKLIHLQFSHRPADRDYNRGRQVRPWILTENYVHRQTIAVINTLLPKKFVLFTVHLRSHLLSQNIRIQQRYRVRYEMLF